MSHSADNLSCPHCGDILKAFRIPEAFSGPGWSEDVHWACFNDDCSYYREGWDWMWERFETRASYRYRVIKPESGRHGPPLAVWSATAIRDLIIEDDDS